MKLGLGTVQFGLPYGVSNSVGQTDATEVGRILERAASAGIEYLDTAPLYGESESRLGDCLRQSARFRIVTKTPHFEAGEITSREVDRFEAVFHASLEHLGRHAVYGLLVHRADDLLKPGGQRLYEAMQGFKQQGLVEKIGISAYSPEQIEQVIERYRIDLVQAPISVFDQRLLAGGWLTRLKERGIEIHARSVFLQGLLLMDMEAVPSYFAPIRERLQVWRAMAAQHGLAPLEAALGFVMGLKEVDLVLCGVNNLEQLEGLLQAAHTTVLPAWFDGLALQDAAFLHPSEWRV